MAGTALFQNGEDFCFMDKHFHFDIDGIAQSCCCNYLDSILIAALHLAVF